MVKTTIRGTQVKNDSLNGSDINDGYHLYDETDDYNIGTVVFWKARFWKNTVIVNATTEGDFSQAPDVSADWDEVILKPIKPYLANTNNITVMTNTTSDIVFTGDFFDPGLDFDLGPEITINSKTIEPNQITLNITTTATEQTPYNVSISRANNEHFGNNITIETSNTVLGAGPAGTFTTNFDTGSNSAARGTERTLSIYGGINSIDEYFQTRNYNQGTPSGSTGPDTSDVFGNGSGQYMYTEVSGPNNGSGKYGIANTNYFRDLTQLDFKYHMYGSDFGDLSVYSQNLDGTRTQRRLVNGQQQTNAGDAAISVSLNTTTWDCKAIEFRFASPTNNTGYRADIAIDDVVLTSI